MSEYNFLNQPSKEQCDFKLSDGEFAEFVAWLQDKDYDYTTRVEKTLDDLIKLSKEEKFNGMVEETIAELKKEIQHNKEKDLLKFQDEIRAALEEDIVSRYYLSKGLIEASFDDDAQLQEAIQVLNDPERYNQLLAKTGND